jgi:hypothetical protein
MKQLSRFRECQNCKHKFIVPPVTLLYESKYGNPIFCPSCNSDNIGQVDSL